MERRSFIQAGLATGATVSALGAGGCAGQREHQTVATRLAALDMDTIIADFDSRAARWGDFTCTDRRDPALDRIGCQAVHVLGLSGTFRDLPMEAQLHPDIQQRMRASLDDMETAVFGEAPRLAHNEFLADPGLEAAIKSGDNPGMRFIEQFDADAKARGLPWPTRRRLRSVGIDTVAQMRRTSPSAVYAAAAGKAAQMQRTAALAGSVVEANRRATCRRVGETGLAAWEGEIHAITAHWQKRRFQVGSGGVPRKTAAPWAGAAPPTPAIQTAAPGPPMNAEMYAMGRRHGRALGQLEAEYEAGRKLIRAGVWVMGVALTTAAVGGALTVVNPIIPVVVSGTIGGILLLTGLVVLAVGASMKRSAKKRISGFYSVPPTRR